MLKHHPQIYSYEFNVDPVATPTGTSNAATLCEQPSVYKHHN